MQQVWVGWGGCCRRGERMQQVCGGGGERGGGYLGDRVRMDFCAIHGSILACVSGVAFQLFRTQCL